MRYAFFIFLTYSFCQAQSLTLGVAGGGRTTGDVVYAAVPESRRYVVGPAVELDLRLGFAVEVDALYHRLGYKVSGGNFAGYLTESGRINSWEFPMLLKYKLHTPLIKPFIEAGVAPRSLSGTLSQTGATTNIQTGQQTPFSRKYSTSWDASVGIVAGGGVQFGLGRLRLSPEVRYTHWRGTPIQGAFADGPSYGSSQDQVDVLVGIGWKIH
jgi:hypothetical protein